MKIFFNLTLHTLHHILKNLYGTIAHPYLTWQHLRHQPSFLSSTILLLLFSFVFTLRAPLQHGLADLPSWPRSFLAAYLIAILSYLIITTTITIITNHLKNPNSHKLFQINIIFSSWIYSYLPTTIWFLVTQTTYYLLPKLNTHLQPSPSINHYLLLIYTLIFITLSIYLLLWKLLLLYLTLRITCALNPRQIIHTLVILIPILTTYTLLLYSFGLWRLPFL